MPTPNLLMLDKELCFAEFLQIEPIIVINKIDLSEEKAKEIEEIYQKTGYKVIKTEAENGIRFRKTKTRAKKQYKCTSRAVRSSENQH